MTGSSHWAASDSDCCTEQGFSLCPRTPARKHENSCGQGEDDTMGKPINRHCKSKSWPLQTTICLEPIIIKLCPSHSNNRREPIVFTWQLISISLLLSQSNCNDLKRTSKQFISTSSITCVYKSVSTPVRRYKITLLKHWQPLFLCSLVVRFVVFILSEKLPRKQIQVTHKEQNYKTMTILWFPFPVHYLFACTCGKTRFLKLQNIGNCLFRRWHSNFNGNVGHQCCTNWRLFALSNQDHCRQLGHWAKTGEHIQLRQSVSLREHYAVLSANISLLWVFSKCTIKLLFG